MSSSNSNNMTVEDKPVQHIKGTVLSELVGGDEDSLRKLVARAVTEALFKDKIIRGSGYNSDKTEPSAVVEAARAYAYTLVSDIATTMFENPENIELIRKAVADYTPKAIEMFFRDRFQSYMQSMVDTAVQESFKNLQSLSYILNNHFRNFDWS